MANEIATAYAQVFRDYNTDGVPASGVHKVVYAEVRGLGVTVQAQFDSVAAKTAVARRVDLIAARMAAGETIKVACYGDSTVDGNQTSGWTANPVDSAGDAVGSSNHAATAPNAWPAVLQTILRAMHGNNNISVWNAGYSGQKLSDGWANRNFDAAIIDNPSYGVPDVVIVAFGLNDQPVSGSQIDDFAAEMRTLVLKILSYDAIPVFLTCDANARHTSGRDNREQSRQIDATKVAVCSELGIPLWDIGAALSRWADFNTDGFRWREQQTDYLHFQDAGHALKAGFVAKQFYRDIVEVKANERTIVGEYDVALGSGHPDGVWGTYSGSNGRFAGNWTFDRTAIGSQTKLIDTWIWCESPAAAVVYRGIDGDVDTEFASGLTNGNYFQIYSPLTGTVTRRPPATGFKVPGIGYRRSDMPCVLDKLKWGLNRVSYIVGSAVSGGAGAGFTGWLDILPFDPAQTRDGIKHTGRLSERVAPGSAVYIKTLPEAVDGCNIFGPQGNVAMRIRANLLLPVGTGFIFAWTPGFGETVQVDGDKSFAMIYRFSDTAIRVHNGKLVGGTVTFASNVGSGAITSGVEANLMIDLQRSSDNQILSVYDGFGATSPAITVTTAYNAIPLPFGGVCGGIFVNEAAVTAAALAEIRMLTLGS